MLNEDRIRVMTRLAAFEKKHEKEIEIASTYYKGDYISYRVIWTGIMTTIAFMLGLGLYFAINFEYYMANMHKMNLVSKGQVVIILYIVCMAVMLSISFFVYRTRYRHAQKCVDEYIKRLRELERNYNNEKRREDLRRKQEEE